MSTVDDPRTWDEQYLTSMLNIIPESLILDYKRSADLTKADEKKKSISKDVSSFANSDGGTLVYGMKEYNQYATDFDEGLNPDEITKEWLENVITSNVRPALPDLSINEVSLAINRPGRVCYVVYLARAVASAPSTIFRLPHAPPGPGCCDPPRASSSTVSGERGVRIGFGGAAGVSHGNLV